MCSASILQIPNIFQKTESKQIVEETNFFLLLRIFTVAIFQMMPEFFFTVKVTRES